MKIWTIVINTVLAIGLLLPILPTLASPIPRAVKTQPQIVNLTGTIHKLALEGTCYQLKADNGEKYELMGKFPKIDGTKVRVTGIITPDAVTICQVGKVVKVKSVRSIK